MATSNTGDAVMPHDLKSREDWILVYEQCNLADEGVSQERFLEDPYGTLRRHGQSAAPTSIAEGYRPLLPAQVAVMQKVWSDWERQEAVVRATNTVSDLDNESVEGEIKDGTAAWIH